MTGQLLFLKSRRVVGICLTLVIAAIIGRVLGPRGFLAGQETPVPVPWVVFVPLVFAYAVASIAASPVPWLELLAFRRVALLSRLVLVVAAALAILLLWWSTANVPPPLSAPAAVRDFLGLLGLSLACVTTLGVTVGWAVPSGMLFSAIVLLHGEFEFLPIDWLLRTDDDPAAFAAALVLMGCGVAATYAPARARRQLAD